MSRSLSREEEKRQKTPTAFLLGERTSDRRLNLDPLLVSLSCEVWSTLALNELPQLVQQPFFLEHRNQPARLLTDRTAVLKASST